MLLVVQSQTHFSAPKMMFHLPLNKMLVITTTFNLLGAEKFVADS
jgi:hypothetical protein